MSNDAGANHVRNQLVSLPVPNEQRGTRTAAAINLHELVLAVGGDVDFVLQNARWPQHADNIGLLGLAQSNGELQRILPQVTG